MKISLCSLVALGALSCGQMYDAPAPASPPRASPGDGQAPGGPGAGPPGAIQPDPWQGQPPPAGSPPGSPAGSAAGSPPRPGTPPGPAGPTMEGPVVTLRVEEISVGQQLVTEHNRRRQPHCAAPLTWSPELAAYAQRWANTLRDRGCAFEHSRGTYGENLAAGTAGTLDPSAVVAMWYDEVNAYSFQQPGFSMKTGHFTQVVWRSTTRVGCATSQCKGMDLWVCEYDPAGNWEGRFREQVLPVGCK